MCSKYYPLHFVCHYKCYTKSWPFSCKLVLQNLIVCKEKIADCFNNEFLIKLSLRSLLMICLSMILLMNVKT